MRWAIEITGTSLDRRNLSDLLAAVGYCVRELETGKVEMYGEALDVHERADDVWTAAAVLRDHLRSTLRIDPDFSLGVLSDYRYAPPRQHVIAQLFACAPSPLGSVSVLMRSEARLGEQLSEGEMEAVRAQRKEDEYRRKLEKQLSLLLPVMAEPRAARVFELLRRHRTRASRCGRSMNTSNGTIKADAGSSWLALVFQSTNSGALRIPFTSRRSLAFLGGTPIHPMPKVTAL